MSENVYEPNEIVFVCRMNSVICFVTADETVAIEWSNEHPDVRNYQDFIVENFVRNE